ncbi:uncharacterized protein LOC116906735 isoform X4 [Rattus rattus]|uniref:uncharacterized protein LOC116906735 isoform X4 n=1 Tax=Rattus rattus TaxID=10117 RepID=UPI0013F37991|nr:uncharacterized protein LOC116906735 isoform X4 [Rattus rattus]
MHLCMDPLSFRRNLSFHPVLSGSEESFSLSAIEVTWGSDTYSLAPTPTSILGLRMSVQATQSQVFFVDPLGIDWGAVQDESPNNTNILTRHVLPGACAFFWLVSLLLSSVFWFLVRVITDNRDGPVQNYLLIFGVLLSVCIQELFRLAYYRLLKKANEGLKSINPEETAPSMRLLAYVSGLGFGIMSGVFSFVNTLSNALGPGTVGIHGDSPQFFLNSVPISASPVDISAVSLSSESILRAASKLIFSV